MLRVSAFALSSKRPRQVLNASLSALALESIVCKRLVCLCHLVHIFFSLHSSACVVRCVKNLVCQPLFHCLLASLTGVHCQPAKSERLSSVSSDLDRYLVCCTTIRLALTSRTGIMLFIASSNTSIAGFSAFASTLSNAPYTIFCATPFLPFQHDVVDKFGNNFIVVYRIGLIHLFSEYVLYVARSFPP